MIKGWYRRCRGCNRMTVPRASRNSYIATRDSETRMCTRCTKLQVNNLTESVSVEFDFAEHQPGDYRTNYRRAVHPKPMLAPTVSVGQRIKSWLAACRNYARAGRWR